MLQWKMTDFDLTTYRGICLTIFFTVGTSLTSVIVSLQVNYLYLSEKPRERESRKRNRQIHKGKKGLLKSQHRNLS